MQVAEREKNIKKRLHFVIRCGIIIKQSTATGLAGSKRQKMLDKLEFVVL